MKLDLMFFVTSLGLGVGLAMDAFSVSMANGLNEPCMKRRKMALISLIFGIFQGMMPLIGWICIHTIVQYFTAFETLIPWIALALLCYIGGKMVLDGLHDDGGDCESKPGITIGALIVQGIATSIDALSVGFTIADYDFGPALLCAVIIAVSTVAICYAGVWIGKTVGNKIAGKASIFGGVILILIGIEIFVTGVF